MDSYYSKYLKYKAKSNFYKGQLNALKNARNGVKQHGGNYNMPDDAGMYAPMPEQYMQQMPQVERMSLRELVNDIIGRLSAEFEQNELLNADIGARFGYLYGVYPDFIKVFVETFIIKYLIPYSPDQNISTSMSLNALSQRLEANQFAEFYSVFIKTVQSRRQPTQPQTGGFLGLFGPSNEELEAQARAAAAAAAAEAERQAYEAMRAPTQQDQAMADKGTPLIALVMLMSATELGTFATELVQYISNEGLGRVALIVLSTDKLNALGGPAALVPSFNNQLMMPTSETSENVNVSPRVVRVVEQSPSPVIVERARNEVERAPVVIRRRQPEQRFTERLDPNEYVVVKEQPSSQNTDYVVIDEPRRAYTENLVRMNEPTPKLFDENGNRVIVR
jgi:hypothetical protein